MPISHKRFFIRVSPGAYIGLCALLLLFPLNWVFCWIAAAAIHELSHYIALRICKVRILTIEISIGGAKIVTEPITNRKECICAAAGPAGGVLLIVFGRWIPQIAVCAFFQTVLNMIPIREFDGGRIVSCLLHAWISVERAHRISAALEWAVLLVMALSGIYAYIRYDSGILIPAVAIILLFRRIAAKIPCKRGKQIVQCSQPNIRGSVHE